MTMFDVSNFVKARRTIKIGENATGVEVDMPFGTLLLTGEGGGCRPTAFIPTGKGKARVDGVQHHVKYGTQRGYGAMWIRQKTGKTTKCFTIECAAALVSYASKGAHGEVWEKARVDGTFATLKAEQDALYAALTSAQAEAKTAPSLPGF